MSIIKVTHLTKTFKRQKRHSGFWGGMRTFFSNEYESKTAVDDISFEIDKGEVVGYIGPNGAGKSTSIKMMVGILVPSSGKVEVAGLVPYENRIDNAQRIGVVFGQRTQLWWDIPVLETFKLLRHMYRVPEARFKANLDLCYDILGIAEFANTPVRQLSLGQRMRSDLAAALLHNPEILYLDEPTIGLDVVVKKKIREFIEEINKQHQTTVILTTHDMSDIEKLCSRVMVIDKGRIMYNGCLEELKQVYGSAETLTAELQGERSEYEWDVLQQMGVTLVKFNGQKVELRYNRAEVKSSMVLKWLMERYEVKDFTVRETEIEEVIRRMYLGQPTAAATFDER